MTSIRIFTLTLLTMFAFAGNSVLCRIALKHTSIDAASFTSIRLMSGAVVLWLIASTFRRQSTGNGNWVSAFALFAYAAGFSFAYISLTAATGALLLFGAVQVTMISHGLLAGERLSWRQTVGLIIAIVGVVGLLLPGISTPPLFGSGLMLFAGVAWGVYSLRGKKDDDPIRVTTGNFMRATVFTILLSMSFVSSSNLDMIGILYAVASGAVASGLGYALWYSVLPLLKATNAATIQLSVPVITAIGGIVILGEPITVRFVMASLAIIGGIALVVMRNSSHHVSTQ